MIYFKMQNMKGKKVVLGGFDKSAKEDKSAKKFWAVLIKAQKRQKKRIGKKKRGSFKK